MGRKTETRKKKRIALLKAAGKIVQKEKKKEMVGRLSSVFVAFSGSCSSSPNQFVERAFYLKTKAGVPPPLPSPIPEKIKPIKEFLKRRTRVRSDTGSFREAISSAPRQKAHALARSVRGAEGICIFVHVGRTRANKE